MFGIWKSRSPEVYDHQAMTLVDFEISVEDFYKSIEDALKEMALEGLTISRIEYSEGGLLSSKRVYLRIQRERLTFDVCAASFGTNWLFTYRAALIPFSLRVWELLVLLAVLAGVVSLYGILFGWIFGSILFGLSILGVGILLRNVLTFGLTDLDASLLRIPVIGGVYEVLFRKETYYREDTRVAYLQIVTGVIRAQTDKATAARGAELVPFHPVTTISDVRLKRVLSQVLRSALQ